MIEDQVRLTAANQAKTHADPGIVGARMTHRWVERQRHANAALAVSCLKRFRDRNPIDGKMIESELILGIEGDARVIGERGAFQIDKTVPADCADSVAAQQLKPLLCRLWDFCGSDNERADEIG
ncbi:hypothetical protein [Bradyrhizobium sp. SK17]|uniref:hypothetical protein n=1 Tax=Bradyrhizobium sp. SK17 TaxID=2057741 RepID=UPI0012FD86F0|nr:hypothetical protein [Bradyrhizobium sp. SK17]